MNILKLHKQRPNCGYEPLREVCECCILYTHIDSCSIKRTLGTDR